MTFPGIKHTCLDYLTDVPLLPPIEMSKKTLGFSSWLTSVMLLCKLVLQREIMQKCQVQSEAGGSRLFQNVLTHLNINRGTPPDVRQQRIPKKNGCQSELSESTSEELIYFDIILIGSKNGTAKLGKTLC